MNRKAFIPKLAGGGYVSRLSPAPSGSGALSSAAEATAGIPPLVMQYQKVERALPPDLGMIPIELRRESMEAAQAKGDKLSEEMKALFEKENMHNSHSQYLRGEQDKLQQEIRDNLEKDQMYYANRMNLKRLQQKIADLSSSEKLTAFKQQRDEITTMQAYHAAGNTLNDIYLNPNSTGPHDLTIKDENGQDLTNQKYISLMKKGDLNDPVYRRAVTMRDENDVVGKVGYNAFTGTLSETNAELNDIIGQVKSNRSSKARDQFAVDDKYSDEYNQYLTQTTTEAGTETNGNQIAAAQLMYASHWRTKLSGKAMHGLLQAGYKDFERQVDEHGYTMGQYMTAAALAGEEGKEDLAMLHTQRDAYADAFGTHYLIDRMGLSKYKNTVDHVKQTLISQQLPQPVDPTEESEEEGGDTPFVVYDPGTLQVPKDQYPLLGWLFTNSMHEAFIMGSPSVKADPTVEYANYVVNAPVYYRFENTNPFGSKTSDDKGSPLSAPITLDKAKHLQNVIIPVSTGRVWEMDEKTGRLHINKKASASQKKNAYLVGDSDGKGDSEFYLGKDSKPITIDGMTFYKNALGQYLEVKAVSAKFVADLDNKATYVIPDDVIDSVDKTGRDMSLRTANENYATSTTVTPEGLMILNSFADMYKAAIQAAAKKGVKNTKLEAEFAAMQALLKKQKENKKLDDYDVIMLNEMIDKKASQIELQRILKSRPSVPTVTTKPNAEKGDRPTAR
jgi:hypothetical protein